MITKEELLERARKKPLQYGETGVDVSAQRKEWAELRAIPYKNNKMNGGMDKKLAKQDLTPNYHGGKAEEQWTAYNDSLKRKPGVKRLK